MVSFPYQYETHQIDNWTYDDVAQAVKTTHGDSPAVDAFGRFRVSNPTTLFDSKQIFDDSGLASSTEGSPLFYDNQQTSGTGTSTTYNSNTADTTLSVSANTAGTRVRQTKMRFNYQPGKSILIFMTFVMGQNKSGITKREGYFDDNNGLFLEANGTNYGFVRRTKTSGSVVDNRVPQSQWNVDKFDGTGRSGVTIDFTKTQIMIIDYEWLGVGRVRMGFVIDGKVFYAHYFNNANNLTTVYMSTPNLPLRSEISNNGSGAADSLTQICSTVISEGGLNDLGVIRYASTNGTHVDCDVENTLYAIIGIKLKENYIGASVKLLTGALQLQTASHRGEWVVLLNPTVAGTFNYTDETYSAIKVARGATANTVTGGIPFTGGFIESGGASTGAAGSAERGIENAILLGSTIAGTTDTIVLCFRPIGGSTNVDVEGSITWRELS